MKFYRVTVIDAHEGTCYAWASSLREAKVMAHELHEETGCGDNAPTGADLIEINGKAELLRWLNIAFTRDNG